MNLYESGKVSASTIITLPVILISDCKCKPKERIWVSAQPVIEGVWGQMVA